MTTDTHEKPASGDMEREAFEKYARGCGFIVAPGRDEYEYSSMAVENLWCGWLAAMRYRDELEKGHE